MAGTMAGKVSRIAAVVGFAGLALGAQAQETKLALGMSGWTGFAPLTLADKACLLYTSPSPRD